MLSDQEVAVAEIEMNQRTLRNLIRLLESTSSTLIDSKKTQELEVLLDISLAHMTVCVDAINDHLGILK
jgi:hypothetical protein